MAFAYGIIKNHGGFITVSREIGHGATFTVHLPATEKAARSLVSTADKIVCGTETILLVDNEDMIIEVGQAMVKRLGYTVIVSNNGKEAIDTVRMNAAMIDLIILDLIMPQMDGGAAFDRIRAVAPDMAVLFSSGYAISGQAEAIMKRGCNGLFKSPSASSNCLRRYGWFWTVASLRGD